jgi:hypothetical protein
MTTIFPVAAAAPVLKVKPIQLFTICISISIAKGPTACEPEKQLMFHSFFFYSTVISSTGVMTHLRN